MDFNFEIRNWKVQEKGHEYINNFPKIKEHMIQGMSDPVIYPHQL